ncbi:MAG: Ergothioneine biosynthesis protein 1 [Claussenomyces sp. TS43310]|nr:MAG: Ergothioneine biosynthesis protein 1 [Claussenomyces sp. TS43310]
MDKPSPLAAEVQLADDTRSWNHPHTRAPTLNWALDREHAQCAGIIDVETGGPGPQDLHMLVKQDIPFHLNPAQYAASTIPTLDDWRGLWAAWDTVTRGMIPNDEMLNKPIKLRNACIFYLGHIPTFLDIQLVKATGESLCEPSYYPSIFERGIDPDVDNPKHCHSHSEIPDEWPPLSEILEYQTHVRNKVEGLYASGGISRRLGRSLWMGFEHEIMHLETLLYMLLQSDRTLAPPRTVKPDFTKDAQEAQKAAVPNEWFTIPEQFLLIGLEDPNDNSGPDRPFGWDNEKPVREIRVPSFEAKGRPITNEEYARYLEATHNAKIPASWTLRNLSDSDRLRGSRNGHLDGKFVRTVYGSVPLSLALHWPVFASYDEVSGCAKWMGGRIPTAAETRSIYSHVDHLRREDAERQLGRTVPAVNGHLVNDGVEESPPSRILPQGENSQELFTNLEDANVGFAHWHPVAVTAHGNKLAGQGEMGGVWEWTSSPLEKYEGFEPMPQYPLYTADFFDGKHNIMLGGSWATHPRIAGRKSFVNWYQRNYPYAWAGARLVRDL